VAVVGGVAANGRLRDRIREKAAENKMQAFLPSVALCGDNAAMIAAAGYHHLAAGRTGRMEEDVFSRSRF
jgi:N6-L-threonylcarbamoyladenine synthase